MSHFDKEISKNLLIFRIIFAIFGWITVIYTFFISDLTIFRYFTIQTNLFVVLWLTLSIILFNKPKNHLKITGAIRGATTLYITVTFLIFAVLLAPMMSIEYLLSFSNISLHYAIPILFIIDFVLTEKIVKYEWKLIIYWLIYPIGYLIFAVIYGTFTGDYIYPFLNINVLGQVGFIISIGLVGIFFIVLSAIYIIINHNLIKRSLNSNTS